VIAAIYFDDQARTGGEEVHDETAERHLAAEPDAEAAAAQLGPEGLLGRRESATMLAGAEPPSPRAQETASPRFTVTASTFACSAHGGATAGQDDAERHHGDVRAEHGAGGGIS
jgi:hypothetical protein